MKKNQKITRIIGLKSAFTLVELIIYIILMAIFILVLTNILIWALDLQLSSESTSNIDADGKYILSRLSYDVSRASNITNPVNLGDTSSVLGLSILGTTYTYSATGGAMLLTVGSTLSAVTSANTKVNSLSFQKVGNAQGKSTVLVNLTIQSLIGSNGTETRSYQTVLGVR